MTADPAHTIDLYGTAATHMVTRIPRVRGDAPAGEVAASLRGEAFDSADTVFVVDRDGRLEGIVRINDLFAGGDRRIGEIMQPEHEAVRAGDNQEAIALLAIKLDMISVPVVDEENRLIGAVPPEAVFGILRSEHMEDLQRLAGIVAHSEGPDVALDAPIGDRIARRLPWLVFGLFASAIITFVMTSFESTLQKNVEAAFFVPALVYIAGAIGTQAVSVAVRGLSTDDVSIGRLLRDELIIGLAIGLSLGAIAFLCVIGIYGNAMLALAVGLAVLGGGAMAAIVGFVLPLGFRHFGSDPALGSGPICTILQDVTSLSLYFVLVSALVM